MNGQTVQAIEVKPAQGEIVPASPIQPTPMDLLKLAMNQNADIGKLEKLMELQLRWEANEAKKAFISAMNALEQKEKIQ